MFHSLQVTGFLQGNLNFVAKDLGIVISTVFAGNTMVLEKKTCSRKFKKWWSLSDSLVPNEWLLCHFKSYICRKAPSVGKRPILHTSPNPTSPRGFSWSLYLFINLCELIYTLHIFQP